ncbi:MAG: HEAT repeat domain-containing protein [Elusimicrobiota bacterium]
MNKYDEALKICQEILITEPRNVTVLDITGSVYFIKGEQDTAFEYWNRSLEINPDNKLVRAFMNYSRTNSGSSINITLDGKTHQLSGGATMAYGSPGMKNPEIIIEDYHPIPNYGKNNTVDENIGAKASKVVAKFNKEKAQYIQTSIINKILGHGKAIVRVDLGIYTSVNVSASGKKPSSGHETLPITNGKAITLIPYELKIILRNISVTITHDPDVTMEELDRIKKEIILYLGMDAKRGDNLEFIKSYSFAGKKRYPGQISVDDIQRKLHENRSWIKNLRATVTVSIQDADGNQGSYKYDYTYINPNLEVQITEESDKIVTMTLQSRKITTTHMARRDHELVTDAVGNKTVKFDHPPFISAEYRIREDNILEIYLSDEHYTVVVDTFNSSRDNNIYILNVYQTKEYQKPIITGSDEYSGIDIIRGILGDAYHDWDKEMYASITVDYGKGVITEHNLYRGGAFLLHYDVFSEFTKIGKAWVYAKHKKYIEDGKGRYREEYYENIRLNTRLSKEELLYLERIRMKGKIDGMKDIKALSRIAKDTDDYEIRQNAVFRISSFCSKEAINELFDLFAFSKEMQNAVSTSLTPYIVNNNMKNEWRDIIVEKYKTTDNYDLAYNCLLALTTMEDENALEILKYTLDSRKSIKLKLWAIDDLSRMNTKGASQLLIESLSAEDSRIRKRAAIWLGDKKVKEAVPVLNGLLNDKDSKVREAASEALKKIDR